MNAIDKARGDPRVQNVLRELSEKVKIKYAASKQEGWGSNLQNDQATISWSGCRHPSASLMHELLHIRLQLKGYRRIRVSISNIADPETAKRLMDCIDNEMQHHKFYPDFLSAGFTSDQFYSDSDADTERFLDGEISSGPGSTAAAAIVFFSLIAPGGTLLPSAKARLRQRLEALDGGAHSAAFLGIESAVNAWVASTETDATEHIRRVLLAVRPTGNLTWYGFEATHRPPNDVGVFVDQPFGVREPQK